MSRSRLPFAIARCRALTIGTKPQWIAHRPYGTVSDEPMLHGAPVPSMLEKAIAAKTPRHDWTKQEIKEIYDTPLMKLAYAAVS